MALTTGPETDVKVMATALGAGILLDATVVRALLVPALVAILGRASWWLPGPAARLLRLAAPPPASGSSRRAAATRHDAWRLDAGETAGLDAAYHLGASAAPLVLLGVSNVRAGQPA